MNGVFNPATDATDPSVRDAIAQLFDSKQLTVGDHFRIKEMVSKANLKMMIVQSRGSQGRWQTVLGIDSEGVLYIRGVITESYDFDVNGWNPSE
jgi:hypothetical protein